MLAKWIKSALIQTVRIKLFSTGPTGCIWQSHRAEQPRRGLSWHTFRRGWAQKGSYSPARCRRTGLDDQGWGTNLLTGKCQHPYSWPYLRSHLQGENECCFFPRIVSWRWQRMKLADKSTKQPAKLLFLMSEKIVYVNQEGLQGTMPWGL